MTKHPDKREEWIKKPERLGRLSMSPLNLEQALKGAMMVPVPDAEQRGGRKKKTASKKRSTKKKS